MNHVKLSSRSDFHWCVIVGLCVTAVVGLAGFVFVSSTRPEELLERGLQIAEENPAESERLLRHALATNASGSSDISLALAWLCERRGEWNEATSLLKTLDTSKCRPDLLLMFGRKALQAQHPHLAVRALESMRNRAVPEQTKALELLWHAYSIDGTLDDAFAVARQLLKMQPQNYKLRMELIKALKGAYREVECLEEIRTGLESNPPRAIRVELKFLLIDQLMVVGDVRQARSEVASLEQLEGKSPRLQSKVIDLLRTEGRPDEALAALSELFPQVKDLPVAYLTRGVILLDLKRFEEATKDLERVISNEPFNEGAQFKLSEAYRGLGKDDLALKHREIGINIRQKRIRINAIMKQQSSSTLSRRDCEELSELNSEVGAAETSQYWKQRADSLQNP